MNVDSRRIDKKKCGRTAEAKRKLPCGTVTSKGCPVGVCTWSCMPGVTPAGIVINIVCWSRMHANSRKKLQHGGRRKIYEVATSRNAEKYAHSSTAS